MAETCVACDLPITVGYRYHERCLAGKDIQVRTGDPVTMTHDNGAKMALAEALFRSAYSDPASDDVDRAWRASVPAHGYREERLLALLRDAGYEVRPVQDEILLTIDVCTRCGRPGDDKYECDPCKDNGVTSGWLPIKVVARGDNAAEVCAIGSDTAALSGEPCPEVQKGDLDGRT